ncbi:hypothetical protein [Christensenella intestinihominis]|uniref:hypothetical protein n=1 Tax=Christensenella intestinihominis TaxID=1851429 RepID=UPI00082B10C9|nr:hypothetical protein [Christensenella intestinihominis]
MKRIIKYVCAIAAMAFVVVMSAWLPPYLARSTDASFLNIIQKDESAAESYEYKATKYQKTKVLYEVMRYNFEGNTNGGFGLPEAAAEEAQKIEMEARDNLVQYNYTDGIPAKGSVMTKAQAELAIVREARLLQNTGALPKFDLGKIGSYDAVESISFLIASDPTVSSTEFYYWQGVISNSATGENYAFIIDDELGKVYYMDISYYSEASYDYASKTGTGLFAGWEEGDMADLVSAFAAYHELEVDYNKDYLDWGPTISSLYGMTNSEFDVLAEVSRYGHFQMILKPSDIL